MQICTFEESKELKIDSLATLTPRYTKSKFEALKESIRNIGQTDPILLRNSKVIDGRHRLEICIQLESDVKYTELGDISDDEAIELLTAKTIVKNKSKTQQLIEAYNFKLKGKKTYEDVAKKYGVGLRSLKDVGSLVKIRPELIKPLFAGERVEIYNSVTQKNEMHDTISTIVRVLKKNERNDKLVRTEENIEESTTEHTFNVNDFLYSDDAIEFFWMRYRAEAFQMFTLSMFDYIELANYKFSDTDRPSDEAGTEKLSKSTKTQEKVSKPIIYDERILLDEDWEIVNHLLSNLPEDRDSEAFKSTITAMVIKKRVRALKHSISSNQD